MVTQAAPEVDSQGRPNREASAGSVLIGASMRHRDGRHHARVSRVRREPGGTELGHFLVLVDGSLSEEGDSDTDMNMDT